MTKKFKLNARKLTVKFIELRKTLLHFLVMQSVIKFSFVIFYRMFHAAFFLDTTHSGYLNTHKKKFLNDYYF